MNKAQKKLIEQAIRYDGEPIDSLYIISTNRAYNGFWGKNGFNEIIIIGYSNSTQMYYKWSSYPRDVIQSFKELQFGIDVPKDTNCVRLFFHKPITLQAAQVSTFVID